MDDLMYLYTRTDDFYILRVGTTLPEGRKRELFCSFLEEFEDSGPSEYLWNGKDYEIRWRYTDGAYYTFTNEYPEPVYHAAKVWFDEFMAYIRAGFSDLKVKLPKNTRFSYYLEARDVFMSRIEEAEASGDVVY